MCAAGKCLHNTEPTMVQLRQALRPQVQPHSLLPSLVLSTRQVPGALMGNPDAFEELLRAHEQTGPVLHELDLASRASVHPRVVAETDRGLVARLTHAHSKFVVGIYAHIKNGAPFGWAYVGSHNFSATSWGAPTSLSMDTGEAHGLVQHSNWECGVLLTVPRGTPPAEAELRSRALGRPETV